MTNIFSKIARKINERKELEVSRKKEKVQEEKYLRFLQEYSMFASIELTCKRPFYDNEFTITYSDGNKIVIKRDYDRREQVSNICDLIRLLPDTSIDAICSLNERNEIYYD